MGNNINGYVGYGLTLNEDGRHVKYKDEDKESEFKWGDELLETLYPEGLPPVEIVFHFVAHPTDEYDEPLVVITSEFTDMSTLEDSPFGVTGSNDGASDLSSFLATLAKRKTEWDAAIAEFVRRCDAKGIALAQTVPHPILYLYWDDGIMGRGVTPRSRY